MATATTEQWLGHAGEDDEQRGFVDCDGGDRGVVAREAANRRVSRLAVEGGDAGSSTAARAQGVLAGRPGRLQDDAVAARRRRSFGSAPALVQQRRSSFTVVRRERAAREAWLDRAWEMKRSWHERNGGAPDADTPVVVVVGKGGGGGGASGASSPAHSQHAGSVGGGGVAMDVDEVRACRDLGLELPPDCTVEVQCYGLTSGGSSPTHTASSGTDSPCAVSSPGGADPMDVKARLKVWAQAVALASTTHLGS